MFLPTPQILLEPYSLPYEEGQSPRGHDPATAPDGGYVVGAAWNGDWRGETFVGADYQGYGGTVAYATISQPTNWSSYTGLEVSQPMIMGYAGGGLQEMTMGELRAGSDIPFPLSGQQGPNTDPVLLEIPFDVGTDVGWQQWNDATRRMIFQEPPTYSDQTAATAAAGW